MHAEIFHEGAGQDIHRCDTYECVRKKSALFIPSLALFDKTTAPTRVERDQAQVLSLGCVLGWNTANFQTLGKN